MSRYRQRLTLSFTLLVVLILGVFGSVMSEVTRALFGLACVAGVGALVWIRMVPGAGILHLVIYAVVMLLAMFNGGGVSAPVMGLMPLVPMLAFSERDGAYARRILVLCVGSAVLVAVLHESWPAARLGPEVMVWLHLMSVCAATVGCLEFIERYAEAAERKADALARAEALALAARDANSSFLNTVSHELRTPLNAIMGTTHLIEQRGEGDDPLLRTLKSSARRLDRLVMQTLNRTLLEGGSLVVTRVPVEISVLLRSTMRSIRESVTSRGGRLQIRERLGGMHLLLDYGVTRHVLELLVDTGVAAWDGVSEASLNAQWDDGHLVLELRYREAEGESLDAHASEDPSTAASSVGTVGGYDVLSRLVERLDGAVAWLPESDGAVCLQVKLPAERAVQQTDDVPRGTRVLLVDDMPANLLVFSKMLERLGCEVHTSPSGAAALADVRAFDPHVVFMDIHMPEMDGFATVEHMKALGSWPTIALTASATDEVRKAAMKIGMIDFITKPASPASLQRGVLTALGAPVRG